MDYGCLTSGYASRSSKVAWRHISPEESRGSARLRNVSSVGERPSQCVTFLLQIERIERVCTIKNSRGDTCYVLNVIISSSGTPMERTSDAERISTFQIQRTAEEFQELHYVAEQWSNQHPHVNSYSSRRSRLEDCCSYCKFFQSATLPGTVARLAMPKKKVLEQLEAFLDAYVSNARLPRPRGRKCQGYDYIPSAITTFLTRDLAPLALTGTQRRW